MVPPFQFKTRWMQNAAGISGPADPPAFPDRLVTGTTDIGPDGNHPTVDIDAPAPGPVTVHIPAAHAINGRLLARLKATLKP